MKYYDKTQFGRDRTPGDPQRFHNDTSKEMTRISNRIWSVCSRKGYKLPINGGKAKRMEMLKGASLPASPPFSLTPTCRRSSPAGAGG